MAVTIKMQLVVICAKCSERRAIHVRGLGFGSRFPSTVAHACGEFACEVVKRIETKSTSVRVERRREVER